MTETSSHLDEALKHLDQALNTLENAVERRLNAQGNTNECEEEIQRMNADRSKLAQELDKSEAKAERLELSNKEVSKRLINAMETIRTVIDR